VSSPSALTIRQTELIMRLLSAIDMLNTVTFLALQLELFCLRQVRSQLLRRGLLCWWEKICG